MGTQVCSSPAMGAAERPFMAFHPAGSHLPSETCESPPPPPADISKNWGSSHFRGDEGEEAFAEGQETPFAGGSSPRSQDELGGMASSTEEAPLANQDVAPRPDAPEAVTASAEPENQRHEEPGGGMGTARPSCDVDGDYEDEPRRSKRLKATREEEENSSYEFWKIASAIRKDLRKQPLDYVGTRQEWVTIKEQDLTFLQPQGFLNDTLIEFYLRYILAEWQERTGRADSIKVYFFSTFFFTRLTEVRKEDLALMEKHEAAQAKSISQGEFRMRQTRSTSKGSLDEFDPLALLGTAEVPNKRKQKAAMQAKAAHAQVRRWTKKLCIFEYDYVFVPVNLDHHWSLMVLCHLSRLKDLITSEDSASQASEGSKASPENNLAPYMLHFDSLDQHKQLSKPLQNYLVEEFLAKFGSHCTRNTVEAVVKRMPVITPKVPQQNNFYDCGVFLLQYAESFLEDNPLAQVLDKKTGPPWHNRNTDWRSWFTEEKVERKRVEILFILERLLKRRDEINRRDDPLQVEEEKIQHGMESLNVQEQDGTQCLAGGSRQEAGTSGTTAAAAASVQAVRSQRGVDSAGQSEAPCVGPPNVREARPRDANGAQGSLRDEAGDVASQTSEEALPRPVVPDAGVDSGENPLAQYGVGATAGAHATRSGSYSRDIQPGTSRGGILKPQGALSKVVEHIQGTASHWPQQPISGRAASVKPVPHFERAVQRESPGARDDKEVVEVRTGRGAAMVQRVSDMPHGLQQRRSHLPESLGNPNSLKPPAFGKETGFLDRRGTSTLNAVPGAARRRFDGGKQAPAGVSGLGRQGQGKEQAMPREDIVELTTPGQDRRDSLKAEIGRKRTMSAAELDFAHVRSRAVILGDDVADQLLGARLGNPETRPASAAFPPGSSLCKASNASTTTTSSSSEAGAACKLKRPDVLMQLKPPDALVQLKARQAESAKTMSMEGHARLRKGAANESAPLSGSQADRNLEEEGREPSSDLGKQRRGFSIPALKKDKAKGSSHTVFESSQYGSQQRPSAQGIGGVFAAELDDIKGNVTAGCGRRAKSREREASAKPKPSTENPAVVFLDDSPEDHGDTPHAGGTTAHLSEDPRKAKSIELVSKLRKTAALDPVELPEDPPEAMSHSAPSPTAAHAQASLSIPATGTGSRPHSPGSRSHAGPAQDSPRGKGKGSGFQVSQYLQAKMGIEKQNKDCRMACAISGREEGGSADHPLSGYMHRRSPSLETGAASPKSMGCEGQSSPWKPAAGEQGKLRLAEPKCRHALSAQPQRLPSDTLQPSEHLQETPGTMSQEPEGGILGLREQTPVRPAAAAAGHSLCGRQGVPGSGVGVEHRLQLEEGMNQSLQGAVPASTSPNEHSFMQEFLPSVHLSDTIPPPNQPHVTTPFFTPKVAFRPSGVGSVGASASAAGPDIPWGSVLPARNQSSDAERHGVEAESDEEVQEVRKSQPIQSPCSDQQNQSRTRLDAFFTQRLQSGGTSRAAQGSQAPYHTPNEWDCSASDDAPDQLRLDQPDFSSQDEGIEEAPAQETGAPRMERGWTSRSKGGGGQGDHPEGGGVFSGSAVALLANWAPSPRKSRRIQRQGEEKTRKGELLKRRLSTRREKNKGSSTNPVHVSDEDNQ